ncbi:MAG: hypothetical protein QOH97_2854 [Actinoplanes sp.]|nr:hypothetical protein [Actinoplanes sp.]
MRVALRVGGEVGEMLQQDVNDISPGQDRRAVGHS